MQNANSISELQKRSETLETSQNDNSQHPRDNSWLEEKLYDLWEEHFADVPRKNLVLIKFGKGSRRQLGSIKWATNRSKITGMLKKKKEEWEIQDDKRVSIITITNLYKDLFVPETVVLATIAHEMAHYTHGFHSPLPQIYDHPHRGNVIQKEMYKRGLKDIYDSSEIWLKNNWPELVKRVAPVTRRIRRRVIRWF